MRRWKKPAWLLFPALALAAAPALFGQGFTAREKAVFEVAADRTAYAPGETVRVAARIEVADHWHVNSNTPTFDYLIPTELSFELPPGASASELTYPDHKMLAFPFTDGPIAVYDGRFTVLATIELPADAASGALELEAALRYQACDDSQCLPPITTRKPLTIAVGPGGEAANQDWFATEAEAVVPAPAAGPAPAAENAPSSSLPLMLLMAVVGGLILNAMPCVLPVLSIKVFGLVKSAGQGRSHLVVGSLATTFGILMSFWALAAAAVLAARAGAAVGWGVQFQQPGFVAFLAVVVVLFSLNMWGLFEIPLPQSLARLAGGGPREGVAGHFTTGLFATLMATPCSAPFLGTAVGFALAQSPPVIFAIFTAVGVGLALPYLLLAVFPGAAALLPKPGGWMVAFRGFMGFLLAGAAVWLFYVLAAQISPEGLASVQLTLLVLALFAWLMHQASRPAGRRLAALGIAATAVAAISLAVMAPAAEAGSTSSAGGIDWLSFDEAEALSLADEGRLVFVDFTADWCLTCKANERLVLGTEEVEAAFAEHRVVPMKGDWTNRDDTIAEFLARYGKSSVPFYLLYRPGQEPLPFSELLTRQAVLEALEDAGRVAERAGQG